MLPQNRMYHTDKLHPETNVYMLQEMLTHDLSPEIQIIFKPKNMP